MIFQPGRTNLLIPTLGISTLERPRGNSAFYNGLVAFWKLDEASGDALDSIGSSHLTETNGVPTNTGKMYATARETVIANTEYFTVAAPGYAALQMGDIAMSINIWAYIGVSTTNQSIIGKWAAGSEYIIDQNGGTTTRFVVRNTANTAFGIPTAIATSAGAWHMLTGWHDPVGNILGYAVDDGTPSTLSWTQGVRSSTNGFDIARAQTSYFTGRVQAAGIWKNYFLSAADRTFLYNGGNGRTLEEMAAY